MYYNNTDAINVLISIKCAPKAENVKADLICFADHIEGVYKITKETVTIC